MDPIMRDAERRTSGYAALQAERRLRAARRLAASAVRPVGEAERGPDPIYQPPIGHVTRLRQGALALAGGLAVHAACAAVVSAMAAVSPPVSIDARARREVIRVDVRAASAPAKVEAERPPAVERRAPPAVAPPKRAPGPRRVATAASARPPTPVEAPVPVPPPEEPAPPMVRRRIAGVSLESVVQGGSGASYAVGDTLLGVTLGTAADPASVVPGGRGPETLAASSNRPASWLPADRVSKPQRTYAPEPVYPPALRNQGIEADVVLNIRVGATGSVEDVIVVRGAPYAEFDRAAVEAARAQRYEPARREGQAFETTLEYTVRFRIRST